MTLVVRLIEIIEKWIRLKCVAVWLISSVYGRRKHTHLPPELQTLLLELLSTFLQALSQLQSAFVKNGSHRTTTAQNCRTRFESPDWTRRIERKRRVSGATEWSLLGHHSVLFLFGEVKSKTTWSSG